MCASYSIHVDDNALSVSCYCASIGWDLVYDNGFIEIDPAQCGYSTFLGAGVPGPEQEDGEEAGAEER